MAKKLIMYLLVAGVKTKENKSQMKKNSKIIRSRSMMRHHMLIVTCTLLAYLSMLLRIC